ncbi:MAG: hypothetical protein JXA52_09400, partial [Planctomycetes bacterium]|nr:hypothetical protein [Planctomycetota bacterium]
MPGSSSFGADAIGCSGAFCGIFVTGSFLDVPVGKSGLCGNVAGGGTTGGVTCGCSAFGADTICPNVGSTEEGIFLRGLLEVVIG